MSKDEIPYGGSWKETKKALKFSENQKKLMEIEYNLIKESILARERANLSQRDLADLTGISQPSIARIEKSVILLAL